MSKQVYLGGDMLSIGQQMRREWEKQELQRLGFKVYAPQDDKDINDKQNANQTGLAERIVKNDTQGMEESDIIIFDYLTHSQGTICELGYAQHLQRHQSKSIYVQCTDVRQGTGHISNEQDRTEFSINQYVYGVILELTEGRGIQAFEEICQELINNEF
ncbi:nucleoside 2-deoxyribosyltransferase [Staphylococcus pettenkoferi]|uniref:nucleoside 2-deoxyribosyltransferase n=1 Tax=Staphylococcus pettenkoferi TaxID=170573 RepID=UPI000B516623|nr:nucleoside 2-deoxyribosyltransferase [Staphylococcus pettenkoferi]ASE37773.1 hypothetical protein CEP67_10960 [Staphylococcus pettenkoferi]